MITWLTTKELSEKLKVTQMTIYNWRKAGMPHITFGKAVRFKEHEVMEWLKEKK